MTSLLNPKRAVLGAVAALAVAAPAAGATTGIDPAIYDSGVAPGTVVHGVESFTITGSPQPQAKRIEFWVGADRWRSQTTDAKTGKPTNAAVHDATGTTWINYDPPAGIPKVEHFAGNDSIPGPGWPAPWNKKLLAGTAGGGNPGHEWTGSLQAIGPVTVAGIAGTKYELLTNGKQGTEDLAGSHNYITLDADAQPLARESTGPNGAYGQFDQVETLISREIVPAGADGGAVAARVSKASFKSSVKGWKAKVAKAKRAAKKHKR